MCPLFRGSTVSIFLLQWLITGPDNHELSMKEFHSWLSLHCPRLLDGVLHWITSSLLLTTPTQSEGAGKGVESHQLLPTPHYYHLPVPRLASGDQSGDRGRETQVLIWALSVCLPLVYLGHSDKEQKRSKVECVLSAQLVCMSLCILMQSYFCLCAQVCIFLLKRVFFCSTVYFSAQVCIFLLKLLCVRTHTHTHTHTL